jgi:tetratricopeptide (TPR) repeat protein
MMKLLSFFAVRSVAGMITVSICCGLVSGQTKPQAQQTTTAAAQVVTAVTDVKPAPTAKELIEQGKQQYRAGKFKPAFTKFESALKLEPQHDEALALAAITAWRLDNQAKARELFQRRAALPDQKASVRAYCDYWSAVTRWRQAHDRIAARGLLKSGEVTYKLTEQELLATREHLAKGLEDISRAIAAKTDYAEAWNIRNLLYSEEALIAEEAKAEYHRKQALDALGKSLRYLPPASQAKPATVADFGSPTVRIGEIAVNPADDVLNDAMLRQIQGGRPIKRFGATLPNVKPPVEKKEEGEDSSGVTSRGAITSVGSGRGAMYGSQILQPGSVKVEVLIGTDGKVVFAQHVGGRGDISGVAVAAAKKWTFEPAAFEGKPVQVSAVITFDVKSAKSKP